MAYSGLNIGFRKKFYGVDPPKYHLLSQNHQTDFLYLNYLVSYKNFLFFTFSAYEFTCITLRPLSIVTFCSKQLNVWYSVTRTPSGTSWAIAIFPTFNLFSYSVGLTHPSIQCILSSPPRMAGLTSGICTDLKGNL